MAPLSIASTNWQTIVSKLNGQSAASFLPKSYTAAQVAGFVAQRQVLASQYSSTHSAVMEIPFSGGASTALVLEKPVSRGVVGINTKDKYAEPTVDFNTLINPVDLDVAVEMVKFTRKWFAAPSHQQLGPQESTPGTNIKTDAQIQSFLRTSMGSSTAHGCCTAPMQPRALGGVVGPDLLVYGVTGLSVADASLMPIIPGTHLCATIYATAEKVR
jgi:choline dehydrogenase-like flavoprotein